MEGMNRTKIATLMLAFSLSSLSFASGEHEEPQGVAPKQAYQELLSGNKRFLDGKVSHPKQDEARRRSLASGQQPHTIVLSCSDSRVPPELVFDQGLGELFTVRVAGNVLGAATVASIEYAVEHLGSRLIVVMGHESCGAVKAALGAKKGQTSGSPDLDTLVAAIQPNLEGVDRSLAAADKTIREPVKRNVNGVATQLLRRSLIVRKAVESGKVSIVPAIYGLESGKVDFWDTASLEK